MEGRRHRARRKERMAGGGRLGEDEGEEGQCLPVEEGEIRKRKGWGAEGREGM